MAALGEGEPADSDARRVEAMVARHGAALLRVASQFSLCHDDALDAYQRALEIYLRKLHSVDPETEGAWLRVVVKHEALAIRRARLETVDHDGVDLDARVLSERREIHDEVASGERVDRSVDALHALKPDEARALLLKAEGHSYQEIGRRLGWSYTKVNRSITEGRRRFLSRFGRLESGDACAEHAAALRALADGTATGADVLSLRPHLRHCATCRAAVRELRFSRARRLALLVPFGWLARLLSRSDVALYAASNGGGRLGPAAALLGLCVGGAGAACVMSGALPAPPIVAQAAKPTPTTTPSAPATPLPTPLARATPTSTPRATVAATPTTAPARTPAARKPRPREPKAAEFSFEGEAARTEPPVASAASVSAGAPAAEPAKAKPGPEFGFEGG